MERSDLQQLMDEAEEQGRQDSFLDSFFEWATITVFAQKFIKTEENIEELNMSFDGVFEMERSIMQRLLDESEEKGREQGVQEFRRSAVSNMLKSKVPDAEICSHLDLNLQEFERIKNSLFLYY